MALPATLTDHYLAVQALTPQSGAPVTTDTVVTNTFSLPFGLNLTEALVIIAFFVVGISIIMFTQIRDVRKAMTILGLILMTSAVPISVAIMNQQTRVESHAGPSYIPKNVIITQITPTGFSVMWETDRPGVGVLRLRPEAVGTVSNRIYSESEGGDIYKHIIKLQNLQAHSDYYFEILSGGVWYDNGGEPLHIQTPAP